MSNTDMETIRVARAEADDARLRFHRNLRTVRARLDPERVREDVTTAVSDRITDARRSMLNGVRQRPVLIGIALAVIAVLIFWRPVKGLARNLSGFAGQACAQWTRWRESHGD
jgi:hypothetical protein